MTEKDENGNGITKKFLIEELKAVRTRADRLQKNLENEQHITRSQHEKNQLIDYRVNKLEEAVESINHSLKNIEEFITRAGVPRGFSGGDIMRIAGVVALILGAVFAAIIKAIGL